MSQSPLSESVADALSRQEGSVGGTIPTFLVGLAVVVAAAALVGPWTDSYVAVAVTAYLITTVFDLVVERLEYREQLLARVGSDG